MQTISINFIVPQGWHELSDKQLRYVYQHLANEFATDEVKTLCLLQWSGTKVIGRQDSGAYLVKKGKILFEVTFSTEQPELISKSPSMCSPICAFARSMRRAVTL